MSTIERPTPVSTRPGGVSRFAGLGFVAVTIAASALVLTGPSVYEGGSLTEYAAAYTDGARELPSSLAAFILMPIAAALLLWAVTHISTVLTQGAPESVAGRVARLGAVAMATLMTAGAAASSAAEHLASGTGDGFPADPAAGYAIDLLGSQVSAVSSWGGALVLIGLGLVARRTGGLPGWLVWAGFVAAPLLVISWVLFNLPSLVFFLWVAVAGFVATPAATATPTAAG